MLVTTDLLAALYYTPPREGVKVGRAGFRLDILLANERGIIVAHTPDDSTEPTSDHFIAMLFATVRQVVRQDRLVRREVWSPRTAPPVGHFHGADLGMIGFGRIGSMIIRKLSGFRMNVRIYDPYVAADAIEAAGGQCATRVGQEEFVQ